MKPVAFLYTTEQGNGAKYLSFSPPEAQDPDQLAEQEVCIDELYTADQLREAQVKVLREAAEMIRCKRNVGDVFLAEAELIRVADELEKADAIRGLA